MAIFAIITATVDAPHHCARGVGGLYIFYFCQLIDFKKRVFAILFDLEQIQSAIYFDHRKI